MNWWMISITVILTLFVLAIIISEYFYRLVLKRNKKQFLKTDKDLKMIALDEEKVKTQRESNIKWWEEISKQDIYLMSHDDLKLHAYLIEGHSKTKPFIILAHGYSAEASMMRTLARYYHETYGFNLLLPDARGHGLSEGKYIGMGWPDRIDYVGWIDYLIDRYGSSIQMALHGISMGGATVMMTSGEHLPSLVKFIIEDCGYSDVETLFTYHLKRMYHLPKYPLIPLCSLICKLHTGYSFKEASSIKQLEKSSIPMLFIHGQEDRFVPFSMLETNYEALKIKQKDKLIVPKAQHGNAFLNDQSGNYKRLIQQYIEAYFI